MKARPSGYGFGVEQVDIDWEDQGKPIGYGGSWFTPDSVKQLITNLQAAVDTYEEEHGQDTDD